MPYGLPDGVRVVERTTAQLPQAAQAALFKVLNDEVTILDLKGVVTAALDATVTTLKITANPTSGADVDLCAAATVTSQAAGSTFSLPSANAGALVASATGVGVETGQRRVPVGTIDAITTGANVAGRVRWRLTYHSAGRGRVSAA